MNSVKIKTFKKPIFLCFLLALIFVGIVSAQQGGNNTVHLPIVIRTLPSGDSWPTVAANPHRTSWTPTEVTGQVNVQWYRAIEAYIPQNVQIIAEHGLLYISTSKGLYALNPTNGDTVWRFDTQLPLGNSPTVVNGIVYVGGYDRKLHALDALTGQHLWSFNGAGSGYATNPLVVNGVIYAGNRDGKMYAIGAHGTANQGQMLWQYQTGGPIHLSAAYRSGVIYFASNDMYAYALNANTGALVWQSAKLPGMQYQSYWPVIYGDKVIFSVAHGYREGEVPGLNNVDGPGGSTYGTVREMQLDNVFLPGATEGTTLVPQLPPQGWTNGYPMVDAGSITDYLENNPQSSTYKHKPWRRMLVVLNTSNGSEFTFDSDQDGFPEYLPAGYWGTGSGNRYPPLVGADGILYFGNVHQCCSDSKGRVMGWNINQPRYLSITGGFAALAEPQAISAGGNMIYRNLCCDRIGDWFNYRNAGTMSGQAWSYNLSQLAPGYDAMWFADPGSISRHRGWYTGNTNSVNAAYHNHGDQNPIIPYQGRLFVHRSNAIIAFGPGGGIGQRPSLMANPGQDTAVTLSNDQIRSRLETEIQKIVDAGHLRPGYYNMPQFIIEGVINYFENPGDTLYTLSIAYPYLSPSLQTEVRTYLQTEFNAYFDNEMYARTGWSGAAREAMDLPPEVGTPINGGNYPPMAGAGSGFIWQYPQHNFYAMWKYAQNIPGVNALTTYNLAKNKLVVPVPTPPNGNQTDYFRQQPYELNAWIAGYIGFLELQELAGMAGTDAALRTQVTNQLNTLLQMRVNIFSKDSYWGDPNSPGYRYYKKHLDISRNFMFMVPELAAHLDQNIPTQVQQAVDEYEYIAPYWFVSRYEATIGEGVMANLYSYNALFQAKAQILCEPQAELSKYLDVPAFIRGDLLYIQNLIAALSVSSYPAC
ncbi:MAG: PQQ-binding-like beta-propeller repeat protein [Anaerolineae bacterium]|nr:PQQ-binding-like beta-propeller repeat protein [Anaerolineae bacterium]